MLTNVIISQSGHPSPTIEDLKRAPEPPVPSLSALQLHKVSIAYVYSPPPLCADEGD